MVKTPIASPHKSFADKERINATLFCIVLLFFFFEGIMDLLHADRVNETNT